MHAPSPEGRARKRWRNARPRVCKHVASFIVTPPPPLPAAALVLFSRRVKEGACWVLLDGFVLDVEAFYKMHPGGAGLIKSELGADITEKFKGGYYKHSNAAKNMQQTLRVARLEGYWG